MHKHEFYFSTKHKQQTFESQYHDHNMEVYFEPFNTQFDQALPTYVIENTLNTMHLLVKSTKLPVFQRKPYYITKADNCHEYMQSVFSLNNIYLMKLVSARRKNFPGQVFTGIVEVK